MREEIERQKMDMDRENENLKEEMNEQNKILIHQKNLEIKRNEEMLNERINQL